ncbi:MAG: hypothetical protein KDA33_13850, partial [Phycisphaerales bacterium]|nr:hypothetical protein [Phycisphaerales bacterium]
MFRASSVPAVIILIALVSGSANAAPTYIRLGMGSDDMSRDGDIISGAIFNPDVADYDVFIWRRGADIEKVVGAIPQGDIYTSNDASVLAMTSENLDNWGDINCFLGNEVAPMTEPCFIRDIAHRWTAGGGWENLGWVPRTQMTVDYACNGAPLAPVDVWVGGTRCDFTVNSVKELSHDGRYVVGAGYVASADPRSNGCAPTGICGQFRAFRYDAMTGLYELLPITPTSTASRADNVNGDGSLVIGYDFGASADPDGAGPLAGYTGRRLAIWRDGVETILDLYGNQDSACCTPDGTQVVAQISQQGALIEFGPNPNPGELSYIRLARWTWNGAGWSVTNLGRPADVTVNGVLKPLVMLGALDVSADGDAGIGVAVWNDTPSPATAVAFPILWSPTINGGVPVILQDYIASQLPPGDTSFDGITLVSADRISDDGRTILCGLFDDASPCLGTGGNAIVDLDGAPCDAPRINQPLFSKVQETYSSFGVILNCFATGTGPLHYQWQRKDLATATWTDLEDDNCESFSSFFVKGSNGSQLRLGLFSCDEATGDYRCVVTNPCGSVATNAAHITVGPDAPEFFCFLPGDMNNDIVVNVDDIPNFVASILCKPFPDTFSPA